MLNSLLWNLLLTAGSAIVLAVACRAAWLRKRPALRHWLWLLLLVKLVTPSFVPVPLLPAVASRPAPTVATAAVPSTPVETFAPDFVAKPTTHETIDLKATPKASAPRYAPLHLLLFSMVAVSLLGTLTFWGIQAFHAVRIFRWLQRAGVADASLATTCNEVAASLGFGGQVRSCTIDTRTTPLVWAWRRPLVVMPQKLLDDLSPQQLQGILAHELAHLIRRDHWANAFALIVKGLLWWNPIVWWADREMRAAQELCCDAMAIDRCQSNRHSYATTLLKTLDFIQIEPRASEAFVPGIGSKYSMLRRFEMIGETQLFYRLSRWTLLTLPLLALALICLPVRAQEEKSPNANAADNPSATKVTESAKPSEVVAPSAIDPKTKELGDAVRKRITTYSDEETLILKEGETGRMKVKDNVTPVAEILITPHFVENGISFDLEGIDASGKTIEGAKHVSGTIHNAQTSRMGLGKTFLIDDQNIFCKIQLHPTRQGDDAVAVEVKALFAQLGTAEELKAMLLTEGKSGQLMMNMHEIGRMVMNYKATMGHYPKNLAELKSTLPKDVYSATGEDYHYEPQRGRFILSSCGNDGIYGNDDDEIMIYYNSGITSGQRHELYPLEPEKEVEVQTEQVMGERPRGNCSISGKVVNEKGEPVEGGRMYLHYNVTHGCIFIHTASDGTFTLKDLPQGPFSLQLSRSAGYQDVSYNPDNQPEPFPPFSLQEGEQRTGIVLTAKQACRVSGKVLDENGKIPDDIDTLMVLAWSKEDGQENYKSQQACLNRADGSYQLDGLDGKPVYVMAINWRAAQQGAAKPPIYYPGVFSRNEAKQITFDTQKDVKNIDITLKKEGGIVLEGTIRDETGKPVPEAFVVVHRRDMLFDFVTAYTNEQGHYEIQGLGDGEFLAHVDAVHRGCVRIRTPFDLDGKNPRIQRDFTLPQGVTITGKFVDEAGNDWHIAESFGYAAVSEQSQDQSSQSMSSFSLTNFWNKHRPPNVKESEGGDFANGEGLYRNEQMFFPATNTFLFQGIVPGKTILGFMPNKEHQKVVRILYNGQDVLQSGIETKPGEEIKDVTIVIGNE